MLAFTQIGCSVFGIRSEENPKYQVVLKDNDFEIREYMPYLAATVRMDGSFESTQSPAFRILAAYIFGENEGRQKISMTAPVVQEPEKISMTAPVVQAPSGTGWEMSFMMPSKYKIEDLPRPKDSRIQIVEKPARWMAVIKFTGFWSDTKNGEMAKKLQEWLSKGGQYDTLSAPMFAGYDPPWTIPFLRRNEMMIEVRRR